MEPLSGVERVELARLRKQVSELEKDNLFLGKAAAYFAAITVHFPSVAQAAPMAAGIEKPIAPMPPEVRNL